MSERPDSDLFTLFRSFFFFFLLYFFFFRFVKKVLKVTWNVMFIRNTRLFQNKWSGIPEGFIAFSSFRIIVINTFEGLVGLHFFIIKRMFLLVGGLFQSDEIIALVKYRSSSSFKFHAVEEIRKFLTLFKAYFFIDHSSRIFKKDFAFVVCLKHVIKTLILLYRLCERFLLTDQKLRLVFHHQIVFLCATLFSPQKFSLFLNIHVFPLKF